MKTDKQLAFDSILEFTFKSRLASIDKYIEANALNYHASACLMKPDLHSWESIWDRLAFAILSANVGFSKAVMALGYATLHKGQANSKVMMQWTMVPAKADYLNVLPRGRELFSLLNEYQESWHEYRLRLQRTIKGLGLAKASFAACLLYPLEADLACMDTWMQKVFLNNQAFIQLGIKDYCKAESQVRRIAKKHGINTFLAQWLIWDHVRNSVTSHSIFPGCHKEG